MSKKIEIKVNQKWLKKESETTIIIVDIYEESGKKFVNVLHDDETQTAMLVTSLKKHYTLVEDVNNETDEPEEPETQVDDDTSDDFVDVEEDETEKPKKERVSKKQIRAEYVEVDERHEYNVEVGTVYIFKNSSDAKKVLQLGVSQHIYHNLHHRKTPTLARGWQLDEVQSDEYVDISTLDVTYKRIKIEKPTKKQETEQE